MDKNVSIFFKNTLGCDNEFIDREVLNNRCRRMNCEKQSVCHILVDLLKANKLEEAVNIIETSFLDSTKK